MDMISWEDYPEDGEQLGLPIGEAATTYYPGRVSLLTPVELKVMRWRKLLFAFMSRNSGTPAAYFDFRANVVVKLSAQVQCQDQFPSPGNFTQQNERSLYRQTAPKKKQYQYSVDHPILPPYYRANHLSPLVT